MTTFGSPAVDYFPTILGCHTRPETMGSLALDDTGLKGALHVFAPLQLRDRARQEGLQGSVNSTAGEY